MISDDEFDPAVCPGSRVIGGLNFRELLLNGSTDFNMESYEVDAGVEEERQKEEELDAIKQLEDPFIKNYSGVRFQGLDKSGVPVDFVDFDGSYEAIAKRMKSIDSKGMVKKFIMNPGIGKQIEIGQVAYIHYFISMESSPHPVDNSKAHRDRAGQPFRFKVGAGEVLPVIDLAVSTMQLREVSKFLAEPEYAYGKLGCPPRIPPDTPVMVTIEVVGVQDGSAKLNIEEMSKAELQALPFKEIMKAVAERKKYAQDSVKVEEYSKARKQYKVAKKLLEDIITPNADENREQMEMLYKLNINIAFCAMKQGKLKSARSYCETAVALPIPLVNKLKGYYRLAKCCDELGDLQAAKKNIDIAYSIGLTDQDVFDLYHKVKDRIRQNAIDEKTLAVRMFQGMKLK